MRNPEIAGPFPAPASRELNWSPGPRAARARQKLMDNAKQLFLQIGYEGVSIEDITRAAGMSRASFYVYFPSKRDLFLALGVDARAGADSIIDALAAVDDHADAAGLERVVRTALAYFDAFGAFDRVWRQVASHDDDLKQAGRQQELGFGRRLGAELERLRQKAIGDRGLQGLAFLAMLEGVWYFLRSGPSVYGDEEVVADLLEAARLMVRPDDT